MPSSRKQITEIKGEGMIVGYVQLNYFAIARLVVFQKMLNVLKEKIPSQKKNDVKINCMQWKLFSFTWLQNQGGVQRILSDYMKRALF